MRLADVLLRGSRGDQPPAIAANEGWLYYVTDEQVLERSNGGAGQWELYAPTGGVDFQSPIGWFSPSNDQTLYGDTLDATSTDEPWVGNRIPRDGTLSKFFAISPLNALVTDDQVFVLRINGVDTTLAVTIPAGTTTAVVDTGHTEVVSEGDIVTWTGTFLSETITGMYFGIGYTLS